VRLREYLEKGVFIFASDYWARAPASNGTKRLGACCRRRSIPPSIFPPEHPIWQALFVVKEVPQVASIQFWRNGGGISERGEDTPSSSQRVSPMRTAG
jgi:hypothetical protein